jgi:1,4-dihydroxy-6-naphthoate synthase
MTVARAWTVGFSSCPNDTFMFDAWVHGAIVGAPAMTPVIEDIEALNERACSDDPSRWLDVTKLSVGMLPEVLDRYAVLGAGAALGWGCGPLVVRRSDRSELDGLAALAGRRVAVPGVRTTAWRLLQAFGPGCEPVAMRFDAVMDAVARGEVDAGLVIHEGRFTYADRGLVSLADLGVAWEGDTGLPVPLGVIAVRRDVPPADASALEEALRASVERAFAEPAASRPWVRSLAQELSDDVIAQHIALYVTRASVRLGEEERRAIEMLLGRCGATRSPWP